MKIEWAEKMAKEVNGSYEHYVDDDLKMTVRVYMPNGVNNCEFKKIKKQIPKNFEWIGIYYCQIEKAVYMLICQWK